jgi:ABC-type lipoprotein release transport system permease subunit
MTPITPRMMTSMMTASYSRLRGAPRTRSTAKSNFCSVTVVIIAALASLYPAWQAAHREPADALHYV